MLLSVLILSMSSCVSSKPVEKVVVIHDVPDVTWPVFPDPEPVTFDPETEIVSMPLWYYQKIAEYKIDVDSIKNYWKALREAENGN